MIARAQRARKGDFIVVTDNGSGVIHQIARVENEDEAVRLAQAETLRQQAEAAAWREDNRQQEAFDASVPALNDRQIRWQTWRGEFYATLSHARAALYAEIAALQSAGAGPERLQSLLAERDRLDRRWEFYMADIVHADTLIKRARRARDAEALAGALAHADDVRRRADSM